MFIGKKDTRVYAGVLPVLSELLLSAEVPPHRLVFLLPTNTAVDSVTGQLRGKYLPEEVATGAFQHGSAAKPLLSTDTLAGDNPALHRPPPSGAVPQPVIESPQNPTLFVGRTEYSVTVRCKRWGEGIIRMGTIHPHHPSSLSPGVRAGAHGCAVESDVCRVLAPVLFALRVL